MGDQPESDGELTRLLHLAADDDDEARDELYRAVYEDLCLTARRIRRTDHNGPQTASLVHEVVLRFEKSKALARMANRRVFFSVASRAMQQILVDHYRRRSRRIEENQSAALLDLAVDWVEDQLGGDLESLQAALQELEQDSPRQHAVALHRFFAGLSVRDTAEILAVSDRTVERDWKLARAKLLRRLHRD